MGYVFGKAFWWILAGIVLGFIAGYLWNGWRRRAWSNTTTATTSAAADSEVERLRNRVANLEPIVADRDALRGKVSELEAALRDCQHSRRALEATASEPSPAVQGFAGVGQADLDAVNAERDALQRRVADHEASLAGANSRIAELEGQLAAVAPVSQPAAAAASVDRFAGVAHDWDRARSVLGKSIKLDDLKVVEGIGPKIEELCHAGGVTTWAGLADTSPERLRDILTGGGDRFRMHDPSSWPRQAELLAMGEWEAFKQLTDELSGGR